MLPFSVNCRQESDGLIELDDGRFQLISGGELAPFMSGYAYVLVERPLSEFLSNIGVDGIQSKPAVILRRKNNIEYESHDSLRLHRRFDAAGISDLDLVGDRIFLMDREYVFVTRSLKKVLESAGFDYLEFHEGLEGFAGAI